MNRPNWRHGLDPRDPDYDPPPDPAVDEEEPPPELDELYGDPGNGPWNYSPMRGDV